MTTMSIITHLSDFVTQCGPDDFYSEATMQLELAIYLRHTLAQYAVHLERPINHFGGQRMTDTDKKEIDICVLSEALKGGWKRRKIGEHNEKDCSAFSVELKFPKPENGRVPETCYDFCKDVLFAERMLDLGFDQAFAIMLTKNPSFYSGRRSDGIYSFFRRQNLLGGEIQKPTGKRDTSITISGSYTLDWRDAGGGYKYLLVEAKRPTL